MKVLNVHERVIQHPIDKVAVLFKSLTTKEDKIWPQEQWPPMRFKEGLKEGAVGGHGPIGYEVTYCDPYSVKFRFLKPNGFKGTHALFFKEISAQETLLKHTIDMQTTVTGTLMWAIAIRWLHDALIEDAFDKVENQLTGSNKITKWNAWVKLLRTILR